MASKRSYRNFIEDNDIDSLESFASAVDDRYGGSSRIYISFKFLITVNVDAPLRDIPGGGTLRINELPGSNLTTLSANGPLSEEEFFNLILEDNSAWRQSDDVDPNLLEVLGESSNEAQTLRAYIYRAYRYNVENRNNSEASGRYILDPSLRTPSSLDAGVALARATGVDTTGREERSGDRISGEDAVAFLLNRVQAVLAILNEKIIENFFEERFTRQRNIIQITSPNTSSIIVNLLTKKPNLLPFFRIRTPYLSFIVPKIRLYKKVFIRQEDNSYIEREGGRLEFKFNSFTSNAKIDDITQHGFGRGDGVGIKDFFWSYEGNNPETVTSFINCDISVYFQNLSDLLGDSIASADEALETQENTDLIQLIGPGIGFAGSDNLSPFRFEIEAELGWELDDAIVQDLADDQTIESIREVIKNTSINLRLSLKEHNIDFKDDGTLTLKLSYYSAIDQIFSDEKLNVLSIGVQEAINNILAATEADREEQLASDRNNASNQGAVAVNQDPCATRSLSRRGGTEGEDDENSRTRQAIRAALTGGGSESIIQNYNNLFSKILENNKVYILEINANEIIDNVGLDINNLFGPDIDLYKNLFTQQALQSLRSNYRITVKRIESFSPGLVNQEEEEEIRQQASESEVSDLPVDSIDTSSITERLHSELASRLKDSEGSILKIEFIRLGDIIDSAITGLKETEGSPLQERPDDFEFITGLFAYRDPITGDRKGFNYSDLLISIDAFRTFFIEKIITPLRTYYSLVDFIVDLAREFSYVNSVANASKENFVAQEGRPTVSVFQAADVELSTAARNASVRQSVEVTHPGGVLSVPEITPSPAATERLLDQNQPIFTGSSDELLYDIENNSNIEKLKFYFILRSNNEIISRDGDEEEDIREGIYHIKLGSDKGILKSISFRRDNIAGRREGRMVRAGGLNVNALREKYDASITLFGAPFIFPGMYIYINPNMIGMGDSQASNGVSAARVLGLGGYYFINKVTNSINKEANFQTEIEASFNAFGPPECRLQDIRVFHPPIDAERDIGRVSQGADEEAADGE